MDNDSQINDIAEATKEILIPLDFIESAVLFGSYAEGKAGNMSDIDIGVATKMELSLIEVGLLTARLENALKRSVDLVILNGLAKRNPVLAYEVATKGKVLLCRNQEGLVGLKTAAILSFIDTAPLRDAVNRCLKERLRSGRFGERNYAG